MLSNFFAVLFYGTLFLYIFIKIYNSILIKKHKSKELYQKQKEEIKQTKFSKVMRILLTISSIGLVIYIPFGITNFFFSLSFMIFDSGEKLNNSFNGISVILYIIYFILITYKLYINILLNKFLLKNKNLSNT